MLQMLQLLQMCDLPSPLQEGEVGVVAVLEEEIEMYLAEKAASVIFLKYTIIPKIAAGRYMGNQIELPKMKSISLLQHLQMLQMLGLQPLLLLLSC